MIDSHIMRASQRWDKYVWVLIAVAGRSNSHLDTEIYHWYLISVCACNNLDVYLLFGQIGDHSSFDFEQPRSRMRQS